MFPLVLRAVTWIGANLAGLGVGYAVSDAIGGGNGDSSTGNNPNWYQKLKQKIAGIFPAWLVPTILILFFVLLAARLGLFKKRGGA